MVSPGSVQCRSPGLPLPPSQFARAPRQQESLTTAIPGGQTCPSALKPTTRVCLAKALSGSPQWKATGPNLTLSTSFSALESNDGIFHEGHTWLPYDAHSTHCSDGNITNPFCEKPVIFAPKNSIIGHETQGKK